MKDLLSKLAIVPIVGPASISADNTSSPIDLKGYGSALIVLGVGIGGITFDPTNKIEFKLVHADDKADGSPPDPADYVAVAAKDVHGASVGEGGIIKALTAAHPAAAVYKVGYAGNKRWLKLLADFAGTHGTATPLSLLLVKGHGVDNPQPAQI